MFQQSQHRSFIVTLKEIVEGVSAEKTKCMFVSCGQNAVQDRSTKTGNKPVDSVAPSKYLGESLLSCGAELFVCLSVCLPVGYLKICGFSSHFIWV
jgi:hypothetical protein